MNEEQEKIYNEIAFEYNFNEGQSDGYKNMKL
jgi:hypothetical protein